MSPSAWRWRLRLPACRPDAFRSSGALRHGLLLASLTCLSLLTVLAGAAAAQEVSFASSRYWVNEGDAATPELVLSHARSEDVTVHVLLLGTRSGEDIAPGPWNVTVPAGQTRQSFSVATRADYKVEGNEDFLLHIATYGHSDGVRRSPTGPGEAVVTITDRTKITARDETFQVVEGATATIRLAIGKPPRPTPFTLDYTLSGTTASGADVTGGFGARSITVPADATSLDISIDTVQDTVAGEDIEWFQVRLSTSEPGIHLATPDIRIGIVDDDTTRVSVANANVRVSEGGTATIRVAIEYPKSSSFTLDYALSSESASASEVVGGFGARSITVPANASHVDIAIETVQDMEHSEGAESVTVRLSTTASNVVFDTQEFQVIIEDDDIGASLYVTAFTTQERAFNYNVAVALSERAKTNTRLSYTVGGTATPGSDYEALSSSVRVLARAARVYIPITLLDDSLPEREETIVLTLIDGGGFVADNPKTFTLTIAASEVPLVDFVTGSGRVSVDEDAGTRNVNVRLSESSSQPITVNYEVSGSGRYPATFGSDHMAQSGTVTIPAGATTASIPVTIVDDGDQEGDETFRLKLVGGDGYGVSDAANAHTELEVTIRDNEQVPVVSFPPSPSTSLDEDAGTHNLPLTLSTAPNRNITLAYAVESPRGATPATPGSDYGRLSGELTISQGATTANIPVTIIDDTEWDGRDVETISLVLRDGEGYRVGSPSRHRIVIRDDERQTGASFALASQNVVEGSGTRNVTVNLDPAARSDLTLNYTVGGSATAGSDYTALPSTVPVLAGATTATIPVTALEDSVAEAPETVILTLAPGTGYGVRSTDAAHRLTIHDATTVTFRRQNAHVKEDAGRYNVTVRLSPAPTYSFTLYYTVGGTATADSDYAALPGSVAVSRGANRVTIPVTIIDDSDREDGETVVLTLTDDADYAVGGGNSHTLTIGASDQPPVPTVEFAYDTDYDHSEVNEDGGTHDVNLRLSHAYPDDITVNYNVLDGVGGYPSATSDSDFQPLSGEVTVPAGATTATITVTIVDDNDPEGNYGFKGESFRLRLAGGAGYKLKPPGRGVEFHQVIIHDNDELPVVTFSPRSTQVGEGAGTYNVKLNLSPAPDKNITVRYRVNVALDWAFVPTATSGADFQPFSGTVEVPASATTATIPVTIIDDGAYEGHEQFLLQLSRGVGYEEKRSEDRSFPIDDRHGVLIIDNDPQIDVSFASASQTVVEGAGTRDVTVNLNPAPTADITLGYSVGGTATADSDYTALAGSVTVPAGAVTATIPVAVLDDSDPEGEETVVLTLTRTEGHRKVSPSTHTLTIAPSDGPPVMTMASFATASQSVGGETGTHDVTVNLNPAPQSNITLHYTVGGSATPGSDYTALQGTLAVSAGAVMATIPVTLLADNVQENRETVVLTLAPGTGYDLAGPGRHTLTFGTVPKVFFRFPAAVASESVGTYRVPVHLSSPPPTSITISYSAGGGTATAGDDYEPLSNTLTVPAGAAKAYIPVTIIDDSVEDSGESVHLRLLDENSRIDIVGVDPPPGYRVESGRDILHLIILNHESGDLEGQVQARLDAAVAGGDSAAANLWRRALAAVRGEAPPNGLARLTQADAQALSTGHAGRGETELASLWSLIAEVIVVAGGVTDPAAPEVTIAADAASVTEGGSASFTLTASPAPAAPLDVTVTVAAEGDYGITAGEQTVTVPTTGSFTLTLATAGDDADEADGSVSVTVDAGDGYTVGTPSSGAVAIADDDAPVPPAAHPVVHYADLIHKIKAWLNDQDPDVNCTPNCKAKWSRVLKALGVPEYQGITASAFSASQADANEAAGWSMWQGVGDAIRYAEQYFAGPVTPPDPPAPDPTPEITIAAGVGVTEGGNVTFILTATPAPAAPLDVTLTVATDGDYGITAGERTVTIPVTGSHELTLATVGDDADEANGSVSVTVDAGDGYTVGTPSSGMVAIADDDEPEVTIAADAASVTEGGSASFTLTADPAPAAPLAVTVTVATDGDYGITAGERTVTIPTTGGYTLTLTTTGDDADEPNGSVSVTVKAGDGYTVGTPSSGTVAIADDDAPAPQVGNTLPAAHPVMKYATLVKTFHDRITARHQHGDSASGGWNKRFLKALKHPEYVNYPQAAVTVADATRLWNHGGPGANTAWDGTVEAVTYAEEYFAGQVTPPDPPTPDPVPVPAVSIAAGAGVTEGGSATFVLTATPAPAAPLDVTVTIAANGDYGIADATRTVTIPTTGSHTLTLATTGDDMDEPNGSVSATVKAGTGYTVGTPSTGAVAIADDDLPPPTPDPAVTIAAGADVTEGGSATFALTAAPAPAAPLDVTVTVAPSGDYGIAPGERTVTVPTTGSATLTLATTGDDADEPDGSVSVTVKTGTGYTVGTPSTGTVAIADDDLPPPVVSVAAKAASITEGGDAVFTVTADRAVAANLAVTLAVAEAAGSDFVAAADEGGHTVTIEAGKSTATLTVRTDDDAVDEPDGSVTATVKTGSGYTVAASPGNAASVAVSDNDAAPSEPSLSILDAETQEGGVMMFTIRLSAPLDRPAHLTVRFQESAPVSARANWDYRTRGFCQCAYDFIPKQYRVTIPRGQTEVRRGIRTVDDSHDEGAETFEGHIIWADVPIADGVAVGTIRNNDPLPAAYLARFGRTVAEQALDGIAGRMSASRRPGMQGTLAGQPLIFGPAAPDRPAMPVAPGTTPANRYAALAMAEIARGPGPDGSVPAGPGGGRFGATPAQTRGMTAREALLGSSFLLTGRRDGAGGSLAFWGRASQGYFDGAERGDGTDITLDGEVTTGMLGADYARGKWLLGLALTQSSADGGYAAEGSVDPCPGADGVLCDGAVRAGDGDVDASLTAAIPWAALQVSERLKLWGAAGYGTGKVTLKTMEENYKADTSWSMAAAGMRNDLLAPPADGSGGPALALTTDALWTRTSSDRVRGLLASDSDATRLRLGLEGSYRMALADGGSLAPRVEIGARHDGGDAETGFGAELGGGIAWVHPALGLSLDVSGRTLVAHENDDLKDRGFSAQLGFDPAPATQRGPSLSLRQDFGGRAQGGLDALFAPDPLEDRRGSEATSRLTMEAAYGFAAFGGRFTGSPHVGMGLSTGARDYSVGWRLSPEAATAPDLSFGLKAMRRESDAQAPEHMVGFEITARW